MRPPSRHTRRNTRNVKIFNEPPHWLICCEGKSEVVYLADLIDHLSQGRKHNIHLGLKDRCGKDRLCGECGRQHMDLVHRVEVCQRNHTSRFEKIWILFDLDANGEDAKRLAQGFKDAVAYIEESGYLTSAWSIPCFEYWLALHGKDYISSGSVTSITNKMQAIFKESCKAKPKCNLKYQNAKGESHCTHPHPVVCSKLYSKPYYNSFACLGGKEGVNRAVKHAKKSFEQNRVLEKADFAQISCCTNIQFLIDALTGYFNHLTT